MKINKYRYLYVLQGFYSRGWADLTQSEDYTEIREDHRDYKRNEAGQYRIISRRVLNTVLNQVSVNNG